MEFLLDGGAEAQRRMASNIVDVFRMEHSLDVAVV
jgi:hypothetical protein